MTDASGWAGLGIGLLRTRRRRRLGPEAEIRAELTSVREALQTIVTVGGWHSNAFTERHDQILTDLAGRVHDKLIKTLLSDASENWTKVFAIAPAPRGARLYVMNVAPDPFYVSQDAAADKKLEAQVEKARDGLEVVAKALDRLNGLAHKAI